MIEVLAACILAFLAVGVVNAEVTNQPNPPVWPDSVKVFDPTMDPDYIDYHVGGAFFVNGQSIPSCKNEFSTKRYAFLFKPGTYKNEVPVGYYTQVSGLGAHPDDVIFNGNAGVHCEMCDQDKSHGGGALITFWRIAENFRTEPKHEWFGIKGMLWAVSQAAPIRRVHVAKSNDSAVDPNLILFQYISGDLAGFASGGYLSNSQIEGKIISGSQQQFFTRNADVGAWDGAVWNMNFVGTKNAPESHCGKENGGNPFVTVDKTPVVAEKPFIYIPDGATGKYCLHVPQMKTDSSGTDFDIKNGIDIPFEKVYVARAENDTVESIQEYLDAGYHIVFAPGIFVFDSPLIVKKENTVLLGLGLATLVSNNGNAVIKVGNIDGVRVSGFMIDAGSMKPTKALLQIGEDDNKYAGNPKNPTFLHDIFSRVGGPFAHEVTADIMVLINSGNVIGDHLWLWRGDHSVKGLAKAGENPNKNGIVVKGDDITMYGLMVEHQLGDLTLWEGENGRTYMYQSELPYDVTQENYGDKGFAGYRVSDDVKNHEAWGVGVYHFMRDNDVTVKSGIVVPESLVDKFHSPVSVYLNGKGTMSHIINEHGAETGVNGGQGGASAWFCENNYKNYMSVKK